ncbi:unnamed protein product [Cuscuta epithymum]|uniref:Uncharacterized protein n=1 Tax=Cuscuta epithymum TaxID=186058 RepID=A0AAV0ERX9_9ASTE|nr:unnamed protein product [Cuscuta epithymum]CAH9126036.1 unnamed protein product [Cuscuta epithymum]
MINMTLIICLLKITITMACGLPVYLEALVSNAQAELLSRLYENFKVIFYHIMSLLHIKVYNMLSGKDMDMILKLMKSPLPNGVTLRSSYYDGTQILWGLGLGYECMHACKYDCVLFWNNNNNLDCFPTCGTSRWKVDDGNRKKIPHKILRYFPLKPSL